MNSRARTIALLLAWAILPGCAETFLIFGPGGLWGPGGAIGSATTQPAAIPGPAFTARQIDPLLESTAGARVAVVADMNADGVNDVVSGSAENQPVQLHFHVPGTLDYNTVSIAGGAPISTMIDLAVADFDTDGRLDVAVLVNDTGFVPVANASLRGAVVLLFAPPNPADALSWQQVTLTDTFLLPNDATGLTAFGVGDIDGQAGPDIVVGSNETNLHNIYLYPNPGGAIARNGNAWARTTVESDAPPFKDLKLADIDLDGDLDVVASYPIAKSFNLRWLVNPLREAGVGAVLAGNWALRPVGEQRVLTQPADQQTPGAEFIAVGDIDGDGDIDVASVFAAFSLIQWFENPGPGVVAQQRFPWNVYNLGQMNTSVTINQLQLIDLNRDGRLDAFATASGNMVGFQPGLDVHNFFIPFSIVGTNPVAVIGRCAFDDVNGDGLLDIIAPMDRDGVTRDQLLLLLRLTP
jgi:hypothetical protein